MRLIVFCGKHDEHDVENAPRENCKTCELLYMMACRDNKYMDADEDFDSFCNRIGKDSLAEAYAGLETLGVG